MAGALALSATAVVPATATAASAPKLGSRTLKPGMRGTDVLTLQRELTQSGFKLRTTGVYDTATAHTVAAFERRYHLRVNSVATPGFVRTLQKIRSLDIRAIGADANGGGGLGSGSGSGSSGSGSGSSGSGSSGSGTSGTGTSGTPTSTGPTDGEGTGATKMPKLKGSKHVYASRILHSGMTGTDVEMLQDYLTLAGFPTSVDGQFGPNTRASVVSFEKTNHYHANGIVAKIQALTLRRDVNTATAATGTSSGAQATLNADGTATAPAGAPAAVVDAIAAANSIIATPYIYGGGHGSFTDTGYDCSGAVSFALHGGGLLATPADSSGLETFGLSGPGKWITVYSDPEHAFVVIAGLAFDTAHYGATFPAGSGPRWLQPSDATANLSDGGDYIERHPAGL